MTHGAEAVAQPARPMVGHVLRQWLSRTAILWVLLLLYLLALSLSDAFADPAYLGQTLRQAAPVGIAAVGTTLVMILGCVDLSIGAIISFAAVCCAVLMRGEAERMPLAIGMTLLLCAAMGAVNGVLVVFNRNSSFILTLGTAIAIYGLTQMLSGGTARGVVSPGFRAFFNQRLGDVLPVLGLCFVLLAAVLEWVARRTRLGRQIYLIGSNREAALQAGVPIAAVTLACYVISGLFAGLGGLAVLARSGVSSTFTGRGFEFDALAAIVLGGTVFSGGRGTVFGTVVGVLVLFIAFNLVNLLGLDYNLQLVLKGAIIILASAAYARLGQDRSNVS
ncbi:MAG: ABC transporter permease [Rubrivivax sp.]|nr:ABC transporter permease [Rubrivivax sp.]